MLIRSLFFLTVLLSCCTTKQLERGLVIAHRGVPYFAPEETTPAFLLARELGADYLEADLQRTKDGVIIALHDDNLSRTSNVQDIFPDRASDPVNTFTWEELQQLDAGSWFNHKYPKLARESYIGLKILSLEELLDIAEFDNGAIGVYLETKHPQQFPGIESDLKQLLEARDWVDKKLDNGQPAVLLQSFVPQSIELLRKEFPKTPVAYLLWKGAGCLTEFDSDHLIQCLAFAEDLEVNIIGASFAGEETAYFNQLEPWFIEEIKKRGMQIHAYTFDTENDINDYAPLTNGQFTNRTDLMLDYYGIGHLAVEEILIKNGF